MVSVTLKHGLLFFYKCIVGAMKILSLHTNCLCLSFALNRLVDRHVPLVVKLVLRDAIGKSGTCGDARPPLKVGNEEMAGLANGSLSK